MITLIKCIIGLTTIMIMWTIIQTLWKHLFIDTINGNEDALMERNSCYDCSCMNACLNKEYENIIKD